MKITIEEGSVKMVVERDVDSWKARGNRLDKPIFAAIEAIRAVHMVSRATPTQAPFEGLPEPVRGFPRPLLQVTEDED